MASELPTIRPRRPIHAYASPMLAERVFDFASFDRARVQAVWRAACALLHGNHHSVRSSTLRRSIRPRTNIDFIGPPSQRTRERPFEINRFQPQGPVLDRHSIRLCRLLPRAQYGFAFLQRMKLELSFPYSIGSLLPVNANYVGCLAVSDSSGMLV